MIRKDIDELAKRNICLLRLPSDEWEAITDTRRQGARFSLNFAHDVARQGQRGSMVLIATLAPSPELRIGVISSIGATSTFDSRVVFDLVSRIEPRTLGRLLDSVTDKNLKTPRDRLVRTEVRFQRVSLKLGRALLNLVAANTSNEPALVRILAHLRRPSRFENARALQQDALALAIKAFGGPDEATAISLPGEDTAIATVRTLEDAVIEHDARWIPGWHLTDSTLTGHAVFEKRGERLDVFTANKRPLEELFGVDLIYLNKSRGALVMVQYKMLEPEERVRRRIENEMFAIDDVGEQEWTVRIDRQFKKELIRMRTFDKDLEPEGSYRLNSSAFFFKLVRRYSSAESAGIFLSLGHLDSMLTDDTLLGSGGGLRISYSGLRGHYLRGEPFVELVRSGYVGTRGATTEHLQTLIEAALTGGRAVVAGIQSAGAWDAT